MSLGIGLIVELFFVFLSCSVVEFLSSFIVFGFIWFVLLLLCFWFR